MSSYGDELIARLAPVGSDDLNVFLRAMGNLRAEYAEIVRDGTLPGYAVLMNPDTCPGLWLGWLAQMKGTSIDPALSDDSQRIRIKTTDGFERGKPSAIVGAAMTYLTGSREVILRERYNADTGLPDAWHFQIMTYTSQTPDAAAVRRAVLAQKPLGDIAHIAAVPGQDWEELVTNYATWAAVEGHYGTWDQVRRDQP